MEPEERASREQTNASKQCANNSTFEDSTYVLDDDFPRGMQNEYDRSCFSLGNGHSNISYIKKRIGGMLANRRSRGTRQDKVDVNVIRLRGFTHV